MSLLGPRVNGKDFNFFQKINVSNLNWNNDSDIIITFSIDKLSIFNEGSGIVEFSFNGNTLHGELNPAVGTSNLSLNGDGITKIWFRLKSGAASSIRIQSNVEVESYQAISSVNGVSGGNSIQMNELSSSADAFGRLRVSSPFTLFENKQLFDDRGIIFDTVLTAGGTSTFNTNRASSTLAVSSTLNSSVIRQTRPRFNYQAGKSLLVMSTAVMGTSSPGITKRAGYYDGYNGVFIKDDGYTVSFVLRSKVSGSVVDTSIPKSSWNIDKFDGYGPSRIVLDITKAQILIFDLEWLGVGRVRYGFNINGINYYAHQISNANNISSVYMSNPNLPIRYEIKNDGYNGVGSLEQICSTILSEGGFESKGYDFTADRDASPLASVDSAANYPLISIRIDPNKYASSILPESFNILCTTTGANFKWSLFLNPTIAGTDNAVWTSIQYSSVQYDISRTIANTASGGIVLKSGYASAGTGTTIIELDSLLRLGVGLSNNSDQLVLTIKKIGGGTDSFIASLSWKEFV